MFMDVQQLQNKKISVIGAARSGVAVAKLLKTHSTHVFVSDKQQREKLGASLTELEIFGIPFEVGGHTERVFDCSLMVVSPGVPSNADVLMNAQKRGINIISELELASWFSDSQIIAITGSNGKTTTTTLLGKILEGAGKQYVVAGNIGTAFSSVVSTITKNDVAVLEVSSFQLDYIESFRPSISVILNITEDHMDRYDYSMEKYAASKARIFINQTGSDVLIYGADDPWTMRTVAQATCRKIPFGVKNVLDEGAFVREKKLFTRLEGKQNDIIDIDDISIRGTHNLLNAMAATLAAQLLGVDPASIRSTLQTFSGVEHRLEFVRELDGVRYVNDSKATNVDSVWYALQAFKEPIVLLLGGRDKGNDYTRLLDLVKEHVRTIIAVGESAEKVQRFFGSCVPTTVTISMEEAVTTARKLAQAGDVVLLSPACASFDWFENFEHRGRVFKNIVGKLNGNRE